MSGECVMSDIEKDLYSDESVKARSEQEDPIVLYFIVRRDLNMSAGKTAAQTGHAAQMILLEYFRLRDDSYAMDPLTDEQCKIFKDWLSNSFRKVVLGADDKKWNKLKTYFDPMTCSTRTVTVRDAGLTEIDPGSETVLAVWPMKRSMAPQVIKKLQALK